MLSRTLCLWCFSLFWRGTIWRNFLFLLFDIEILMDIFQFDRKSDLHFDWHILWLRCDDATEKVISIRIRIMDPTNRFILYPLHFYSLKFFRLSGFKYHTISPATNLFRLTTEIETFPYRNFPVHKTFAKLEKLCVREKWNENHWNRNFQYIVCAFITAGEFFRFCYFLVNWFAN